ncbi:MAG TPA: TIGR02186 family protein, partial [Pseudolabrys sp.]
MIRSRLVACLVAATALFAAAAPASAEKLIVSLSNHRVLVTSNFDGEELVLFGTIEPDAPRGPLRASYDVVVTVSGPATTVRTRRKERTLGIWINQEARQFINVPSYLAVLSNRPMREITNEDQRRLLQLGLDNVILRQRVGSDIADTVPTDPFREAFVRLQTEHGVYRANAAGVTFLTP